MKIHKLTLSALFLALGLLLPFLTGQIQYIGNMLLPMHFPVYLCGFLCGGWYGGLIGFLLPLIRFACFGMPPLFPVGFAMAFELATYGMVVGFLYQKQNDHSYKTIYISLIIAMILGRLAWAITMMVCLGISSMTWQLFITSTLLNAIPGILLQLILIPIFIKKIQIKRNLI